MGPQALLEQVGPFHVGTGEERPDARDLLGGPDPLVRQVGRLAVVLDLIVLRRLLQLGLRGLDLVLGVGDDLLGLLDSRGVFPLLALGDLALGVGDLAFGGVDLLLDTVVAALQSNQLAGHLVRLAIAGHVVVGGTGDDQRGPRFVDQNRVHLVDDRVLQRALHHLLERGLHVVAEIVEAELVVRAVGDVGPVLGLAFLADRVHIRLNGADGQAQGLIDRPHPLGVSFGQVIVHGDQVDVPSGQVDQIDRQRGDERLAFTGGHFGDPAVIKDVAADELDVEMPHLDVPPGGLANGGERLGQKVLRPSAAGDGGLELACLGLQRFVAELLHRLFERRGLTGHCHVSLHQTLVPRAKDLDESLAYLFKSHSICFLFQPIRIRIPCEDAFPGQYGRTAN